MNHFALFNIVRPYDVEFERSIYYNSGIDLFVLNWEEVVDLISKRDGTAELIANWMDYFEVLRRRRDPMTLSDICMGVVWKYLLNGVGREDRRGERALKSVLDSPLKILGEMTTFRQHKLLRRWAEAYYSKHYYPGIQYMGVEEHPRTSMPDIFWDGTKYCARCGRENKVAFEGIEVPEGVLVIRSPLCGHPHFSWLFHCSEDCAEENKVKAAHDWKLYKKIHKECCTDYCRTYFLGDCVELFRATFS